MPKNNVYLVWHQKKNQVLVQRNRFFPSSYQLYERHVAVPPDSRIRRL